MRWLAAGLIFVVGATCCGLFLGMVGHGLRPFAAGSSLVIGALLALTTYIGTVDPAAKPNDSPNAGRYRSFWMWGLAAIFTIFAVRAFCWLLYIDGGELRIQSPNNLGDLALHITYIRNFANGVTLWPDNPIFVGSKLRYPAGTDLFNALLYLVNVDLIRGLVWAGLLGSLATFYALWRWGREFAIAGFLFNGGTLGFEFLRTWQLQDYQGDKTVAWKSIPLSMFVTQRGWLYAIPAGLLLLWHWRQKFFRTPVLPADGQADPENLRPFGPLPFAVELALYASMPFFNVHTFLALSTVLVFIFLCGDAATRKHLALLIGAALIPATFFVWLVSDNFHASSMLQWKPGWVLHDPDLGRSSPLDFWFANFGIWFPLILILITQTVVRLWKAEIKWNQKLPEDVAFLMAAVAIFLAGMLFKFAPWEWDNLKIMIWGYFLVLPFLWTNLIQRWSIPVRIGICIVLFGSGFVTLFGGLSAEKSGFGFFNRGELAAVGVGVRTLPVQARFAAFPTYNHPLLLQGRKVVMGYPGHLWTQGFDYSRVEAALNVLMNGGPEWRQAARALGVRYVFWGREEKTHYPQSTRPWETTAPSIPAGDAAMIYDLEALEPNAPRTLGSKALPSATP